MYGWIFRHLPGPKWLKIIQSLLLIALVVYALFQWVYPYVFAEFDSDMIVS